MKKSNEAQSSSAAERLINRTMRASDILIGCLILVAIALNFGNVIARYMFSSAISWAEEALIFISIWCVFLGAAASAWEDAHLRMDLFLSNLSGRLRKALDVLGRIIGIAVGAVVVYASWQVVSMMARFGQKSTSTDIPMAIPHAAITLGFTLIVLAILARAWIEWRKAKSSRQPTPPRGPQ